MPEEKIHSLLLLCFLGAALLLEHVFTKTYEPPTNLTHITYKNGCTADIQLRWTEPNTTLTVENYVIEYYTTKQFSGTSTTEPSQTLQTADNITEEIVSISGSYTTAYFNISANFSNEDGTFTTGSTSDVLEVNLSQTNCNASKPTNVDGDGNRDMMYAVKLASIIIGASIGLILLCFTVFRLSIWCMERKYDQHDLAQSEKKGHSLMLVDHQLPISADNFYEHVSAMKFSDNRGFKAEFAKVADASARSWAFGNRPYNASKNRYANVPTYDKTRVVLEEEANSPSSSYVNANYVDGWSWPNAYIATQAPLPETFADFWRMIWEKEINCIVMIVNLKEKDGGACAKYWPDKTPLTYGKIVVKLLEEKKFADYTIRTLELQHCKGMEQRLVHHFQYTSWPVNRSVPVHPISFLEFVKRVASFRADNKQPVVVHCSSGSGRTGVYVIVDTQLNRIASQEDVNIFYNLDVARSQRFQIIRSLEEYIFVHECILDHLTFKNNVDIVGRNIEDYIARNRGIGLNDGKGFQKEFTDVTTDATEMYNRTDVAKLPHNSAKNRFENILPFDHSRVKLKHKSSSDGSDYINASYFDSIKRKRSIIVTQSPMEETLYDFWCMVWQNACLTIIMLSHDDQNIVPYWPKTNEVLKADKIQVRLISIEKVKHFQIRHMEITHTEHSGARLVRQYHFDHWPDKSNDASVTQFVNFVLQCRQWNETSKSKTMTVHCRAGTGKSGVFVALCQLTEKMEFDGTVNVVQTVRRLRQHRMAMIQTVNQYELLYHAMAVYYKMNYQKGDEKDAPTQSEQESSSTSSIFNTSFAFTGEGSFAQ